MDNLLRRLNGKATFSNNITLCWCCEKDTKIRKQEKTLAPKRDNSYNLLIKWRGRVSILYYP